MKKLKLKIARVLCKYFQSMGKQISKYVNNTRRLWKTIEYCERAREYGKVSFMIYPDGWDIGVESKRV